MESVYDITKKLLYFILVLLSFTCFTITVHIAPAVCNNELISLYLASIYAASPLITIITINKPINVVCRCTRRFIVKILTILSRIRYK